MSAIAHELGLSEAIGALMAGIVLGDVGVGRDRERFLGFRDLFAALFFFAFGLSIDVEALGSLGWLLALAVVLSVAGKLVATYVAGRVGGFSPRQSVNAGAALVSSRRVRRSSSPRWRRGTRRSRPGAATSSPSPGSTCSQPPSSGSYHEGVEAPRAPPLPAHT